MKTTTNPLYFAFVAVVLAIAAATTNGAPGDLYVTDQGSRNDVGPAHLYAFTPNTPFWTQTTSSIEYLGALFEVGLPLGVVFDNEGNRFVSHPGPEFPPSSGGTIIKITPDGTPSTFASGLRFPVGLAFDTDGNLFVADNTQPVTGDGKILKFSRPFAHCDNVPSTFASGLPQPRGVVFDLAGNLFVSDDGASDTDGSGKILTFTPPFAPSDNVPSTFACGLTHPRGIAFDAAGNLYVAERGIAPGDILKFTPTGTPPTPTGSPSTFATGLSVPVGIALDGASNVFVVESNSSDIKKITPDGTTSVVVSPPPDRGGNGPLIFPAWLAFEPNTTMGTNEVVNIGTVGSANTNIALTFPNVSSGGTTMATAIDPSSAGYTLPGSSLAFDIATTAAYPTPVPTPPGIVIAFRVAPPLDVSQLTVFHNDGGTLVNVTCPDPRPGPTPDTTTNTIYASVTSLSPFVVAMVPFAAHVQQPINSDGSSVFSVRRGVVPVKFTLSQGGSQTCALPPATIAVTRNAGGTIGSVLESVYSGSADNGSNFRIDGCQYVYNLSASALGVGTYRVDILIGGVVVGSGTFGLH